MGHPWRRRRLAARKASGGSATSGRRATGSNNGATHRRSGTFGNTGLWNAPALIRSDLEPSLWRIISQPTPVVRELVRDMHPDWSSDKIDTALRATPRASSTE